MEQDVLILSPEKTILSLRLAGIGARITAHIVDILILGVALFVLGLIANALGVLDPALSKGFALFASFVIPLAYFILLEGLWNGQTIGKKLTRIRVRMIDGTPITFAGAIGRNLLRPADILPGPYLVGLMAMFTNPRGQRIGDLVAGTMVCYEFQPEPSFAITPHSVGVHPLEGQVGDLRGMTIDEYNALRLFADRFPQLPMPVQDKLVATVWTPIAERRSIPQPVNIHPIYLAEAVVMKYGRQHGLL